MSELDRQIEEALDAEDRALLEQFGEQGLIAQSFSVFQGKQGWLAVVTMIPALALFIAAVYCAWMFFQAGDGVEAVRWGAAAWLFMTMVAFIKVWFWMRMESNRVLREIKRVELQLARLQARRIA